MRERRRASAYVLAALLALPCVTTFHVCAPSFTARSWSLRQAGCHHRRPPATSLAPLMQRAGVKRRLSMTLEKRPPRKVAEDDESQEFVLGLSETVAGAVATAGLLALTAYGMNHGGDFSGIGARLERLVDTDVSSFLQESVDRIHALGPLGYVYFGVLYVVAEILAIPAMPLTASSGFLFGLYGGTAVVIVAATVAAGISFTLGRTFLRNWVLDMMGDNEKFKALDRAVAKHGFKIVLLLRLSPVFPFALSNYLYGLTAVDFWPYICGTAIGFFPGTLAYVYTGQVGQSLLADGAAIPTWGYVVAVGSFVLLGKVVADIAQSAVAETDPELANGSSSSSSSSSSDKSDAASSKARPKAGGNGGDSEGSGNSHQNWPMNVFGKRFEEPDDEDWS